MSTLRDPNLALIIQRGMDDTDRGVRGVALSNLNKIEISKNQLPSIVNPIFEKGSLTEQQQLLQSMGKMKSDNTSDIFEDLIQKMVGGKLEIGIKLDLIEAVEASKSDKLVAKLDALKTKGTLTDEFKEALLEVTYKWEMAFLIAIQRFNVCVVIM